MDNNSTIGIETWGGGSRSQKAKPSKLSLVIKISDLTHTRSLDITPLCIKDLKTVLAVAESGKKLAQGASLPEPTRFKKPYIAVLKTLLPTVQLEKLSVAALSELIGAFSENHS